MDNPCLKEAELFQGLKQPEIFSSFTTRDQKMFSIFQCIESIAVGAEPVLITGESGVGKELIAEAIHKASGRQGIFVTVNASGLDDTVFSDTLFGHKRGAFTSAEGIREGLIEKASGGTLFLDEIGNLRQESQIKILRVLQSREYYPLGSDQPLLSKARIVAATNMPLTEMVKNGTFRKDLYYRLNTHGIQVPSLKERKEDIPLLVECFVAEAAKHYHKNKLGIPHDLYPLLLSHHFEGNIRELRAMIFDAVSRNHSHILSLEIIKSRIFNHPLSHTETGSLNHSGTKISFSKEDLPTMKEAKSSLIREALRRSQGVQSIASRYLGITPAALCKYLKQSRSEIAL